MKRNIRRTAFFATLLLGLAAVASAQDTGACSLASMAGQWAFTWTGTLVLPTGGVPAGAVGTTIADSAGNFAGTQTSSSGGKVSAQESNKGTLTVNPDCTGTMTVSIYDQSGNVLRKAVWATVTVDNGAEILGIMTSLQLGDGTNVPAVVTISLKRVSSATWILRFI